MTQHTLISHAIDMFAERTRNNCKAVSICQLTLARYDINPAHAAAYIECYAYIDRCQTDIENPEGIYIEVPVAKLLFCHRHFCDTGL